MLIKGESVRQGEINGETEGVKVRLYIRKAEEKKETLYPETDHTFNRSLSKFTTTCQQVKGKIYSTSIFE